MAKNDTVGQRVNLLIQALGMSKNAFALSLDKTATVVQHIVDERNKPGFDLLLKMFEVYPNVSKDWLMQGVGPMFTTPEHPNGTLPLTDMAEPAQPTSAPEQPTVEAPKAPVAASAAPKPEKPEPTPEPEPATPTPPTPATPPAPPVRPDAAGAAGAPAASGWEAALYAQQLQHQLTLAEMRNQHLLEQQKMLQQMVELLRR